MKASNVWESVITPVAAAVTTELAAKSLARLMSIQFRPDTLLICGLLTALVAAYWIHGRRQDRSMKLRLDLLFRMCYQGPFLQQIRQDAEEKALYGASILRRLKDLAELVRSDPDDHPLLLLHREPGVHGQREAREPAMEDIPRRTRKALL